MRKTIRGFTIIELLVVVAVMGILATIGLVSFARVQSDSRDKQRESRITIISEALEKYYAEKGEYPSCAAMAAAPSTVISTTLKGLDPSVLTAPKATSGTNSILVACADLSTTDAYAYVGLNCNANRCQRYTLKYREESTGNPITLVSRHSVITISLTAIAAISGTTTIGSVLTAGALTPLGATVTYQWQSATTAGGTYTDISSATVSTYTIVMGDSGKYIKVVATATGNYTGTQTSVASTVVLDPNWLAIGTQVWAKYNLNVGTMVTGVTNQTNNSILEKYCVANTESNCTTYGGLYLWDEAMQYVITEGARGICPAGSHIPSDNDWKILEMQLGMTQAQADATGWRGTDQGTQLKPGGSSGLNIPLGSYRYTDGNFYDFPNTAHSWSSSESSTTAWERYLVTSGQNAVYRRTYLKVYGVSVRCLRN